MRDAEFIKSVTITTPADQEDDDGLDYVTLELYQDPGTGKFFAVDADYLEGRPNHIIFSPFSKGFQLRLP